MTLALELPHKSRFQSLPLETAGTRLLAALGVSCTLIFPTMNTTAAERGCQPVAAKFNVPFCLNPRRPWVDTAIDLKKGETYLITATDSIGDPYKDDIMPCTPDGPRGTLGFLFDLVGRNPSRFNPLARGEKLGVTKRLRVLNDRYGKRTSFLTLIATIGADDSQANTIRIGKARQFKAHTEGRLFLFANDWPGGPGTEGDERFYQTCKCCGKKFSPTYDNNKGHLHITVTPVPAPR